MFLFWDILEGVFTILLYLGVLALPVILYILSPVIMQEIKDIIARKNNNKYFEKCKEKYNQFSLNEKTEIYQALVRIKKEKDIMYNRNAEGNELLRAISAPDIIDGIKSDIRKKYKIDIDEYNCNLDLEYLYKEINKKK